ncbi:MAG: hypothetical protein JST40_14560 [Armatimonadetes bacterium]|nr:hypothetical protein [Armatimonadota bacterium]
MSYDPQLVQKAASVGYVPRSEEPLSDVPEILVKRALARIAKDFGVSEEEAPHLLSRMELVPRTELASFEVMASNPITAALAVSDVITKRLDDYYVANFRKVYDNVMGWFGTTSNGCVAFLSSALRLSGYLVPPIDSPSGWGPRNPDGTGSPHLISEWTGAFQWWIAKQGWQKIVGMNQLQRGDVVFANDNSGDPVPSHVFEFHSWIDQASSLANVLDNQNGPNGLHQRPLASPGEKDPYRYHFRK